MQQYILIVGVNGKGQQFRPRDWASRICDMLASYGGSKGITRYNSLCVPYSWLDYTAVKLNLDCERRYPQFWKFVTGFARDNDLKVIDFKDAGDEQQSTTSIQPGIEQRISG